MQESGGCVRVPTSNNGVQNPGLMQCHDGKTSCHDVDPCPASKIHQMIEEGTAGTKSGAGLKRLLQQAKSHGTSESQDTYIAARVYNSGQADYKDLNNPEGATASYANEVATRLTGWTLGKKGCIPK